ncbi:LysE family translocator [Roseovarius aestuariivivens]|uniref:LysE family translocator n=1 Tax=Roseovarius aestuariivivens TaxID=1888910 RepID=UPI001081C589|nr:LysE family translocator [Roseovarius aestuariivivens]
MTLSALDLWLYSGAMAVLFLTPGPVWLALAARSLSGGFHAAWPLAVGVAIGDMLWPLLAVLGVTWIVLAVEGLATLLRWSAVAVFAGMGGLLIRYANAPIVRDGRLTRPGVWRGFIAGLAVILSNPKAILFYIGILPGFFDLTRVTWTDVVAIVSISFLVPLSGNLVLAALLGRLRGRLTAPQTLRRINLMSGALLLVVAVLIAFG